MYGRAQYNVPDTTGTSRWSDTRTFSFFLDENTILGFYQNTEGMDASSWVPINKNGTNINKPDYTKNLLFKAIRDDVTDDKGNVFVEIPKFYVKVLPKGIEGSNCANKKTWFISQVKFDSEYKVHPAFIRNGKEYNKLRIAKYRCRKNIDGVITSKLADTLFPISTIDEIRTKVNELGTDYRIFDIWDLSVLKLLLMLYTVNYQPVKTWLTLKDGNPNSIIKIAELIKDASYRHFVDRVYLDKDGKLNIIGHDQYSTNPIGKIEFPTQNYTVWKQISDEILPGSGINTMVLFLPKTSEHNFTSVIGSIGIESLSNNENRYMFLHEDWSRSAQYTYQRWEYDTHAEIDKIYSYYQWFKGCTSCPKYSKQNVNRRVEYRARYGAGSSCPSYMPGYKVPGSNFTINACRETNNGNIPPVYSHATCMTAVGGCGHYFYEHSHYVDKCSILGTPTMTRDCGQYYTTTYKGGMVLRTYTGTTTVTADASIYSAHYSRLFNNRTFRFCYNLD